jgi:hypothetical protein
MCGDEDGAEDPVAPVGTALDAAAAESCTGVDPEGDAAGTGSAGTRDENGSDTDGYHRYHICFHIYVRIRIRIRIV